jgi:hypothetical protein
MVFIVDPLVDLGGGLRLPHSFDAGTLRAVRIVAMSLTGSLGIICIASRWVSGAAEMQQVRNWWD